MKKSDTGGRFFCVAGDDTKEPSPCVVSAVVLAGGYSSRMGKFKPLLELGGAAALERCVHCFHKAGVLDVRVVTGHRADELAALLSTLKVKPVHNPAFNNGMYSSVQAGVRSLGPDVSAFFILPVDYPLVKAATIRQLLGCFYRSDRKRVIYPVFNGKRGHPPLITTKLAEHILSGSFANGLRGLLHSHENLAVEINVADEGIHMDMDIPTDYCKLLTLLKSR